MLHSPPGVPKEVPNLHGVEASKGAGLSMMGVLREFGDVEPRRAVGPRRAS